MTPAAAIGVSAVLLRGHFTATVRLRALDGSTGATAPTYAWRGLDRVVVRTGVVVLIQGAPPFRNRTTRQPARRVLAPPKGLLMKRTLIAIGAVIATALFAIPAGSSASAQAA